MYQSTKIILLLDLAIALVGTIAFVMLEKEYIGAVICCDIFASVLIPVGFLRWRSQVESESPSPLGQKILVWANLLALVLAWIFFILLLVGSIPSSFTSTIVVY